MSDKNESPLRANKIAVTDKLSIYLPTVGEILDTGEKEFYETLGLVSATPYDYRLQLYEQGIKYEDINEYDMFIAMFAAWQQNEHMGLILGNETDLKSYRYDLNNESGEIKIVDATGAPIIDRCVYTLLTDKIRQVHFIKKNTEKFANDNSRDYFMRRLKRKLEREARKPYEPTLEALIIALVNTPEFPYNYETVMDLNIYKFNCSIQQVQRRIIYDKVMTGIHVGMINTKELKDKSILDWTSPLKIK